MNKNSVMICVAIVIMIMVRIAVADSDATVVVAALNIVALVYVLLDLEYRIYKAKVKNWEKNGIPKMVCDRNKRIIKTMLGVVNGITMPLGIIPYFIFWCSDIGNDIISIVAVGVSVLEENIIEEVKNG